MPFCYTPWTNLDISPTGDITPCCKFQSQYYSEKFNIKTSTIKQYSKSEMVSNIKREFLEGIWPQGCERCRIEETNGIASKRQLDYDRWQDHYKTHDLTSLDFITASIAFGNTCNLKCIICNPQSSSRWQQEYKTIFKVDVPHFKFYKQNFVEDFTTSVPKIVHLDIPGGEPFLSGVPEQKALLQHYIDTGRAADITIHYTTNATIFPDAEWWELWKPFKEIDLQLSIDGIGNRYEYLRYPAKWNETRYNIKLYLEAEQQISNVRLSVSHTVSAYNILYLDEFFAWSQEVGLPKPWLGRVHNPGYMRPGVWPSPAKEYIQAQLDKSNFEEVRQWSTLMANQDDSEHFELFCQRLKQHDEYRGVDFSAVFPELASYIND